jgi:hypothetical protein
MLCSSLVQVPAYEAALFNRDGRIPDVAQLQGWIERAWAAGFDVQVRWSLPRGGCNSFVVFDVWR